MTRKQIKELNEIALVDWAKAQAMLEGINMVLGTEYGWLNKRVTMTWEDGSKHDAWVWAE